MNSGWSSIPPTRLARRSSAIVAVLRARAMRHAGFDMILHATYMDEEALAAVIENRVPIVPTFTFQANLADYGATVGASPTTVFCNRLRVFPIRRLRYFVRVSPTSLKARVRQPVASPRATIWRPKTKGAIAMVDNQSTNVYKQIELVGSSPDGTDAAVKNALDRAGQTLRNLRWFEVVSVRGGIEDEKIREWQVTLKAAFVLD